MNEPLPVEQPRRLFQQPYPPPVVLDQVVVGGQNGCNAVLDKEGREAQFKVWESDERDAVHCGAADDVRLNHHAPSRCHEIIVQESRMDFRFVGPDQRHAPAETPPESLGDDCISVERCLVRENDVVFLWNDPFCPFRIICLGDVSDIREIQGALRCNILDAQENGAVVGFFGCGVGTVIDAESDVSDRSNSDLAHTSDAFSFFHPT